MLLNSHKKQSGVILIFILLILTLLTLTTVSQIEQNKNQLAITSNMGMQIRAFSKVESALNLIQTEIETKRQPNKDNLNTLPENRYDCSENIANQFFEGDTLTLISIPSATATIRGVSCIINSVEYRCVGNPYASFSNTPEAITACQRLTNAQCPTELYTIDVTFNDVEISAKRTVRSRYSIGCSVFAV